MQITIKKIVIFDLVLLLLVLGVAALILLNKTGSKKTGSSTHQTPEGTPIPRKLPAWYQNLTDLEKTFFQTPADDAPSQEKENYSTLLSENAQATGKITISSDCKPSPVAFRAESADIVFQNEDSLEHKINVSIGQRFILPPNSTTSANINVEKAGMILSYRCDSYIPAGFIVSY